MDTLWEELPPKVAISRLEVGYHQPASQPASTHREPKSATTNWRHSQPLHTGSQPAAAYLLDNLILSNVPLSPFRHHQLSSMPQLESVDSGLKKNRGSGEVSRGRVVLPKTLTRSFQSTGRGCREPISFFWLPLHIHVFFLAEKRKCNIIIVIATV